MTPEDRLRELQDPDRWRAVRVPRSAGRARTRGQVAPARAAQLIAAFTIVIVLVAGGVVALVGLRGTPTPAATAPAVATSAPSPSGTSAPAVPTTFSLVPGATHIYSGSALPAACTLTQLRTESKQDGGGAAGSYIQAVYVLNTGSDCLIGPDAVRVGGRVVSTAGSGFSGGLVLPSHAVGQVMVTTAEVCQPGGTKANIDPSKPVLPIELASRGQSRTMAARFPRSSCAPPSAEVYLADPGSVPIAQTSLVAAVAQPAKTPRGALRYDVSIRPAGSAALALSSCPTATEVVSNHSGVVLTRAFSLRCTIGSTLQPDTTVTLPVSTTIPSSGDWTILWYLGGAASNAVASTTCTLTHLAVSEPGPGGAAAGNWVQLVSIRNRGPACTLPVTAFGLSGRAARAGQNRDKGGFTLAAGSTTQLAVQAATTCADGTLNIASTRSLGSDAKPLSLTLQGSDASGLHQPFPRLRCAGPYVDRTG